ncbi:hypothetical protein ACFX5F_13320 [Flavobacterium sp. ZS1P70]|uniref:Uncharacterized protein n=1 Tax=Flavobacterium zhoui TaxID=3230414 RepID=A0ABW6I7E8_9FLAO
MENKILDELLKYLLETDYDEFAHIRNDANKKSDFLKNIDNAILKSALLKLVKDGYVNQNSENTTDQLFDTPRTNYFYNISFEGRVFIKNGGYENQNRENQKKENWNNEMTERQNALEEQQSSNQFQLVLLTWVIAIGTLVAAAYYLIEILKFFCVLKT